MERFLMLVLYMMSVVEMNPICSPGCLCTLHRVTCNADYGTNPLHRLPTDLPNDTLQLFVAYNEISVLGLELYRCPELVTLDLTSNKLDFIADGALIPLNALDTLVLAKNNISSANLPPHIFKDKGNLHFLDLSSNRLGPVLHPDTFIHLDHLVTLLLEGNHITDIPSTSMRGLSSLQVLVLRDNWLTSVPHKTWRYVPNLQELDLSNNNISVIKAGDFRGLNRLRELDLIGEDHLHTIRNFAFSDLQWLQVIRVRRCRYLTVIEPNAFANIYHLKKVHLQENALTTMSGDILQWTTLTNLLLFDNPWMCNCRLQWLREVLSMPGGSVVRRNDVICDSPASMRGDVIAEIPSSSFICQDGNAIEMETLARVSLISFVIVSAIAILGFVIAKFVHRLQKRSDFLTTTMSYGSLRLQEGQTNLGGSDRE